MLPPGGTGLWWKLAGAIVILVAAAIAFRSPVAAIAAALALLAVGPLAVQSWRIAAAVRRFRAVHGERGRDLLLVYSASPHWQRYVEEEWLPRWSGRAVVLDWSARARWTGREAERPEVALFRAVAGPREFNPLAVVVPLTGPIRVVRFWRAFRDYKHGNDGALRSAERELSDALWPAPGGSASDGA